MSNMHFTNSKSPITVVKTSLKKKSTRNSFINGIPKSKKLVKLGDKLFAYAQETQMPNPF